MRITICAVHGYLFYLEIFNDYCNFSSCGCGQIKRSSTAGNVALRNLKTALKLFWKAKGKNILDESYVYWTVHHLDS